MGEATGGGSGSSLSRRLFGDEHWGVRSIDGYSPPDSAHNRADLARFAVWMAGAYAAVGALVLGYLWVADLDFPGLNVASSCIGAAIVAVAGGIGGTVVLQRLPLVWVHAIALFAVVAVFLIGLATGPNLFEAPVLAWVIVMVSVSVGLQPRAAIPYIVLIGVSCGVMLGTQDGYPRPVGQWFGTVGGILIVGRAVTWLVERIRVLALDQRRASQETEELARTLEQRVEEQVEELGRLGRLQRFLPTTLVDAVLTDGEALLAAHRQQIAVFFCDLRGFTAFTADAGPEDVDELLRRYYELLGDHARRYQATVGAFTGDGLMAFFNDPLPCPDPVDQALRMSTDLQAPVNALLDDWRAMGHILGFGIGIAFGWANIGMIGFEGRRDYTALGSVVNLASRLCAEAPSGGILLDSRAQGALHHDPDAGRPVNLRIKGYNNEITAYDFTPGSHA